jgi:hypothetical protein
MLKAIIDCGLPMLSKHAAAKLSLEEIAKSRRIERERHSKVECCHFDAVVWGVSTCNGCRSARLFQNDPWTFLIEAHCRPAWYLRTYGVQ